MGLIRLRQLTGKKKSTRAFGVLRRCSMAKKTKALKKPPMALGIDVLGAAPVPTAAASMPPAKASSFLQTAFETAERGDMVSVRQLLAQTPVESEAERAAAIRLAVVLSSSEESVAPTVAAVQAALVKRTRAPAKSYWFVGVCLGVFSLLVALASLRYNF
jgi:hypothetical protein